jgi:hypothetical protein
MHKMLSPAQIAANLREIPRFQLMFAALECFIRSLRKLDKDRLDSFIGMQEKPKEGYKISTMASAKTVLNSSGTSPSVAR